MKDMNWPERVAYLENQLADSDRDNKRLRAGLQLIAGDKNRLMNEVARQTAASILGGKPIGEVAEWPKRDVSHAQLAEAQSFPHGAAVTGCDMKINDEGSSNAAYWYERAMKAEARLQKVMARCADLLDEDQFNELDAIARTADSASGGE